MKVVLFCGGQGMRLRDYSPDLPKPLVELGSRPILWHLMKYYAHFGHREFVLCLGHGGSAIKNYFLRYEESVSNDFVLSEGGRRVELLHRDLEDWRITFVDTGSGSTVGERLRQVRPHLNGDDVFMANYADALTDLDLDAYLEYFERRNKIASFVSVAPPHTFHVVRSDADHHVRGLEAVASSAVRINGGFFVFRQRIFAYLRPGEELVVEPFERLIGQRQLLAYPFDGFWLNMDTFKDKQRLDELLSRDDAPWQVWRRGARDGRELAEAREHPALLEQAR
jgi:glucose-1-phosphate cytidylyltransferase